MNNRFLNNPKSFPSKFVKCLHKPEEEWDYKHLQKIMDILHSMFYHDEILYDDIDKESFYKTCKIFSEVTNALAGIQSPDIEELRQCFFVIAKNLKLMDDEEIHNIMGI